jgi:hypothetical protein
MQLLNQIQIRGALITLIAITFIIGGPLLLLPPLIPCPSPAPCNRELFNTNFHFQYLGHCYHRCRFSRASHTHKSLGPREVPSCRDKKHISLTVLSSEWEKPSSNLPFLHKWLKQSHNPRALSFSRPFSPPAPPTQPNPIHHEPSSQTRTQFYF